MPHIKRIVIIRLFIGWLMISALTAVTIYWIESRRIDEAIIALAANESQHFAAESIDTRTIRPAELAVLRQQAAEFVRNSYVSIKGYDHEGRVVFDVKNDAFESLRNAVSAHPFRFPRDDVPHFRKLVVGGETLVQVQRPLKNTTGTIAGHIEAVFVVKPDDLARLNDDLKYFLVTTLLCVLLTTLLLYPIIITLNRKLIRFSDKVIKGNLEIVTVLGAAIAKRDSDTGDHNYRVTLYAIHLAEALGIEEVDMRALILGAFLHDVGKIGIQDSILLKPASLSEEEIAIMRTHVQLGMGIIQTSEWLQAARDVIECHHEHYDGSGYLKGLRGENIPLAARIFCIVDVFDALTSKRPYKDAWTVEDALALLQQESGRHFDPQLVLIFEGIAAALYHQFGRATETELNAILRQLVKRHYLKRVSLSPD